MNDPRRRYGTQLPDWVVYHTSQIAGVKSPRVFRWVPLSKRCDSELSDLSCSQSPSGELEKKIQNLGESLFEKSGSPGGLSGLQISRYLLIQPDSQANARSPSVHPSLYYCVAPYIQL